MAHTSGSLSLRAISASESLAAATLSSTALAPLTVLAAAAEAVRGEEGAAAPLELAAAAAEGEVVMRVSGWERW
jgi:hypothetical protein